MEDALATAAMARLGRPNDLRPRDCCRPALGTHLGIVIVDAGGTWRPPAVDLGLGRALAHGA